MAPRDDDDFPQRRSPWSREEIERDARAAADLRALRQEQSELRVKLQQTSDKLDTMTIRMTELSKDFWYVKGIVLGFALIVLVAFGNALVEFVQSTKASVGTP